MTVILFTLPLPLMGMAEFIISVSTGLVGALIIAVVSLLWGMKTSLAVVGEKLSNMDLRAEMFAKNWEQRFTSQRDEFQRGIAAIEADLAELKRDIKEQRTKGQTL